MLQLFSSRKAVIYINKFCLHRVISFLEPQLLDHFPIPFVILDDQAKIIFFNQLWKQKFNQTEALFGAYYFDVIGWKSPQHIQCFEKAIGGTSSGIESEEVSIQKDVFFWMHWQFTPYISRDNKKSVLIASVDITPVIQSHSFLHQESKLIALGQMASGLAHEINNPLSVIRMNAEMLMSLINQDVAKNFLLDKASKIIKTSDRITGIIRALKSISASSSNVHFSYCSLEQIIKDIVELSSVRMKNETIQFTYSMSDELKNYQCYLESTHISQAIINLVNNSIDAISECREKWIRVEFQLTESKLQIRVIDSGAGIPEHLLHKIRQKFFSSKKSEKGLGLGLNLVTAYVASHGGELVYGLSEGHTSFTIELPRDRVLPDEIKTS
jgi:signal transduction histidine kinase